MAIVLCRARWRSPTVNVFFGSFSSHSQRQTTRKVSPLFRFGAPLNSSTTPCTISAIWFTKVITFDCNTSVAMLKFRMLIIPSTQLIRRPGIITFTEALSPPLMFSRTLR